MSPEPGVPQSRKGSGLSWTSFKVASVGIGANAVEYCNIRQGKG